MRPLPHVIGVAIVAVAIRSGWIQGKHVGVAQNTEATEVDEMGSGAGEVKGMFPLRGGDEIAGRLVAWAERLAAADGTGMAVLASEAARETDGETRERLMRLVAARWSEVDPEGGVAYFLSRDSAESWHRVTVLTEWALRDVEAALQFLKELGAEHATDIDFVGQQLMREEAGVFWAWFKKARRPNPGSRAMRGKPEQVWIEIARRHRSELEAMAYEAAAGADRGQPQDQEVNSAALFAAVASARAEEDPAAAVEWARSLPAEFRAPCLRQVLPILAEHNPQAAMAAFESLRSNDKGNGGTSGQEVLKALPDLLAAVGKSDAAGAVAWAARLSIGTEAVDPVNEVVRSALADGRLTPQAAFALVDAQATPGESIRINVLRMMWRGLPPDTLAASAAWLNNVESSQFKGTAMGGIVTEWALSDREAALAFARSIEDPAVRQPIWGELLGRGAHSSSFAGALGSQLAEVPAPDRPAAIAEHLRLQYGGGMLDNRLGPTLPDPQSYAEALMEAPAGPDRTETTRKVMNYWGALDPASAMAWTGQHTEGAERAEALAGLVAGWARHDRWAVSEWLADQPTGVDRDATTRQFALSISPTDPGAAWSWATEISDPAIRMQAGIEVLQRWHALDPGAAATALTTAPLAPHERQSITEALTRARQPQ